ncbi:hypothetical protein D3C73_1608580 [compost metagenome]
MNIAWKPCCGLTATWRDVRSCGYAVAARAGRIAVLRPNTTVTITPAANNQVIGWTCSPKNSAENAMVKKICNNWI